MAAATPLTTHNSQLTSGPGGWAKYRKFAKQKQPCFSRLFMYFLTTPNGLTSAAHVDCSAPFPFAPFVCARYDGQFIRSLKTRIMKEAHFFSETISAEGSPETTTAGTANAEAAVRALSRLFEEQFKSGDAAAMAAQYSPEGLVMPPNREAIGNARNIAALWDEAIRAGVKELGLRISDISGSGNYLTETGTYEMLDAHHNLVDKGKFLSVWRLENGQWKVFRDIWNTSLPAAPAR